MRYAMLVGCVWLGASAVGCGGVKSQAPLLDEKPVAASAGEGGGAEIDTGQWAYLLQTPETEQQRRRLYEQVAKELGLEQQLSPSSRHWLGTGEAMGGGGRAGGEKRSCEEILAANEPASVASGRLDFAVDGLLTLNVQGEEPMKLRVDESTCAVQGHQVRRPDSLLVGTETQVSYVLENGLPTARVVRAEPVRPTH